MVVVGGEPLKGKYGRIMDLKWRAQSDTLSLWRRNDWLAGRGRERGREDKKGESFMLPIDNGPLVGSTFILFEGAKKITDNINMVVFFNLINVQS